jgi:serine/threonine protein phosphatase PrpC
MFEYAVVVRAMRGAGQDRAAVFARGEGITIALADGAGGTGSGEIAAQAVIDRARVPADDWCAALDAIDTLGQTTAIVLDVDEHGVRGASVGDSHAWLVRGEEVDVLTADQHRKPLLGDGAQSVAISRDALGDATLVVGSDGLFAYARPRDIARLATGADLDAAVLALVELVRLPTGGLQDDVSVVLARRVR